MAASAKGSRDTMNGRAPTTVTCDIGLRLVVSSEDSLPVPAELRYEATDPYAVHAAFSVGDGERVSWVFARDLLSEGVRRPTGQGDVSVWPARSGGEDVACITLSSPEGHALLECPLDELTSFVDRTYRAVPPGSESRHVDIDAELAQLLDRA